MEYTNSKQVHLHPVAMRLFTEVKVHRRKIKHIVHKTIHSSSGNQHKCFCKGYSSLSGYCGGKIVHCLPIVLSIQPSTLPTDQSTRQLAF
jgi:hypothetical protein